MPEGEVHQAAFPNETAQIGPDERFFCRVHRAHYKPKEKRFTSAAFKREAPDDFSTDWEKYKAAEDCVKDTTLALIAFTQRLCSPLSLMINHTPIQPWEEFGPNQAHADICGEKTVSVVEGLKEIAMTPANVVWRRSELVLATDTPTPSAPPAAETA